MLRQSILNCFCVGSKSAQTANFTKFLKACSQQGAAILREALEMWLFKNSVQHTKQV